MRACRYSTRDWNIVSNSAPFSHSAQNILYFCCVLICAFLCFVLILLYRIWLRFFNRLNNRFVLDAVDSCSCSLSLSRCSYVVFPDMYSFVNWTFARSMHTTMTNPTHHTGIRNNRELEWFILCIKLEILLNTLSAKNNEQFSQIPN